jgi:hypothetical protein
VLAYAKRDHPAQQIARHRLPVWEFDRALTGGKAGELGIEPLASAGRERDACVSTSRTATPGPAEQRSRSVGGYLSNLIYDLSPARLGRGGRRVALISAVRGIRV